MITIKEKLLKYKNNPKFCESYSDCKPIEEVEGKIIPNATWSGYRISDDFGNNYFTDYGIRGWCTGTFIIEGGEPVNIKQKGWIESKDILPGHENKVSCIVITIGGARKMIGYFCHDESGLDKYGWNFGPTREAVLQILAWKEL